MNQLQAEGIHTKGQISFLLFYPMTEPVIAESIAYPKPLKRIPYFQPVDLNIQLISAEAVQLEGVHISLQPQIYEETIYAVDCRFPMPDYVDTRAIELVNRIKARLTEMLVPEMVRPTEMWEEYTILLLESIEQPPDEFVSQNGRILARLLRAQSDLFTREEEQSILSSRLHYSEQDLIVVDWSGGLMISPEEDYQSELEVLKIGVYQLLRYRMLDKRIDEHLQFIRVLFDKQNGRRRDRDWFGRHARQTLKQIINERLTLLLDFERVDQDLLMIGDWYTAQLYRMIIDEFYLDEWKHNVKSKLENLASIVQAVRDNFTISWSYFLDIVQLVGWIILLIGYFVLFYFDTLSYLPW